MRRSCRRRPFIQQLRQLLLASIDWLKTVIFLGCQSFRDGSYPRLRLEAARSLSTTLSIQWPMCDKQLFVATTSEG